ncbi:hypothetical protein [Hydrogenophaga sp.]|uniref:L,D-transpeptidase Cds6 family protein n=1 Tax=Hydrogenophaga sp. TaxID=1904254 RepID=UPI00261D2418|nr:hypothetical protein [Hydrogenophaga sp.]MDM7949689.1 hypothetical protein [Hydrogenophaga sp.]
MTPKPLTGPEALAPEGADPRRRVPVVLLLGVVALIAGWALWSTQQSVPAPSSPSATAASSILVNPPNPGAQPVPAAPLVAAAPIQALPASPMQAAITAPEPPSAPEVLLVDQVARAVESWRQDWAARNMMAYLDHYNEAFTPADGVSRRDWIASRYRNVGGRTSIEVQIKDLQIFPLSDDRVRVGFLQDYASGSYREIARPKTLELVLGPDDRWRIVGEWQGKPPALVASDNS